MEPESRGTRETKSCSDLGGVRPWKVVPSLVLLALHSLPSDPPPCVVGIDGQTGHPLPPRVLEEPLSDETTARRHVQAFCVEHQMGDLSCTDKVAAHCASHYAPDSAPDRGRCRARIKHVKVWYINRFDHPVVICAGNDGMVKAVNIPDFNMDTWGCLVGSACGTSASSDG